MVKPVAQRLFFALWPEPEIAQQFWQLAGSLVPKGIGRRLPAEHIHLTLAFLGSVDTAAQQCLMQAADLVHAEPFELALDLPGHFPRPQVVWLGTHHVPLAIQVLQSKLVSQLTLQCAYKHEARPFVPHVTLWRKVKRVDLPSFVEPITWPVSHFVLARSRTLPSGADYDVLKTWPLGNQAG